jgi:hypothetical protein
VHEVKKVQYTVYECVPVQKQVTVKVCNYRAEEREYTTRHIVCDTFAEKKDITVKVCNYRAEEREYTTKHIQYDRVAETQTVKQRYCVMVPVQVKVSVPVCGPAGCCH